MILLRRKQVVRIVGHLDIPGIDEPLFEIGPLIAGGAEKNPSRMHELAERKIDQEDQNQGEVQTEKPRQIVNPGLQVNQAQDDVFHVHQIGPEKNFHENPADRDPQQEKEGEIIAQDGNVKVPLQHETAGEEKSQRERNQIPGVKPEGLDAFHPAGNGIKEIPQMPQKDQPQQGVEKNSADPEESIPFEKAGKPDRIPDDPPYDPASGLRRRRGDNAQRHRGLSPGPDPVDHADHENRGGEIRKINV